MIEIDTPWFPAGKWLVIHDQENSWMDYSCVLEQLFAQMMGWA